MEDWLHGFGDVTESVKMSVDAVRNHPLNGYKSSLSMDSSSIPTTGKLDIIVDGYKYNSEKLIRHISREINKSRFLFTGIGFLFLLLISAKRSYPFKNHPQLLHRYNDLPKHH